ncbi:MAG: zinc metalloprotease HtpX [Candidatus Aenigmarchaeota archaeon]|nr:zinc metalloprotease HtpX [Candidatus Aenigmarchaeota archaeon]
MWIIRTALLFGLLTGLLLGIGYLVGGSSGAFVALIFAGAMNFISYWFSDKIVLSMYGAKEISENENPALHASTASLAQKAGIPKPKIYFVNNPSPNAFATGRSPAKGAVVVTKGLLDNMEMREVEGVIAHELGHIKNRDTLISAMAATVAGAISFIANMLQWSLFARRDERNNSGGALFAIIFAPFMAMLIQLAISRSREYSADSFGAKIASPLNLASALRKLDNVTQRVPMRADPSTGHLFIVNPFKGGLASLFMTHPPLQDRIKRLEEMAYPKLVR